VIDVAEVGDRVDESVLREEPGRGGWIQGIADQREGHRHHEHVAHEVVTVVAPKVEPQQEPGGDQEVAVHVHLVGDVDQPSLRHQQRLQARLEEGMRRALEVDDLLAVGEGGSVLALGHSPHGLVADVGQHEEADLPKGIWISLGQLLPYELDGATHPGDCKAAVSLTERGPGRFSRN
jgi:hypothetical protein